MRNNRGAFAALTVLGGYVVWRNRFAIQRRLESIGVKTPVMDLDMGEAARSIASKAAGKMEHGATIAENMVSRGSENLTNRGSENLSAKKLVRQISKGAYSARGVSS